MSFPNPQLSRPKSCRANSRNSRSIIRLRRPATATLQADPASSAKQAGLRYVSDGRPGLHRVRAGRGVKYLDASGKIIHDKEVLGRIKSLAIPPAWTDVWICP